MARKTRTARRRYDPSDFLTGDGWNKYILDGTPLLPSLAAAQEAWEQCRVECWRLWLEGAASSLPPAGAIAHDDILTLGSIEEFRRRRPRTSAQIREALDTYEAQLRREIDERLERQANQPTNGATRPANQAATSGRERTE